MNSFAAMPVTRVLDMIKRASEGLLRETTSAHAGE